MGSAGRLEASRARCLTHPAACGYLSLLGWKVRPPRRVEVASGDREAMKVQEGLVGVTGGGNGIGQQVVLDLLRPGAPPW